MKPALLLVLLGLCSACAQAAPPKPLLWKVSDADNHVYLLGSFHALKPDDYPLAPSVDAAIADAEKFTFELSPEELHSPDLQKKMEQAALLRNGQTLRQTLPAPIWSELHKYLEKNALPEQSIATFQPWYVSLIISVIELQRVGYDPKLGLDQQLMDRVSRNGKPATGLETGDQQIAALDSMTANEQQLALQESLDEAANFRTEMDALHREWRAGDADALFARMGIDLKRHYPALYQRIDVDRNQAWLPKIRAMLDNEKHDDTMVVVGSLHLLGPDGLVAKLKAAGYRVERVN
jgi:uncharacterized protein YbaP (TraB family)